jgi:hypothetical protein
VHRRQDGEPRRDELRALDPAEPGGVVLDRRRVHGLRDLAGERAPEAAAALLEQHETGGVHTTARDEEAEHACRQHADHIFL